MLYLAIGIGICVALIGLSIFGLALLKLGIQEYFKQKRIYLLEMLQDGIPEDAKEHK